MSQFRFRLTGQDFFLTNNLQTAIFYPDMGIEGDRKFDPRQDDAEFRERLLEYANLAGNISAEQLGSAEWLGGIGKFWWKAREQAGVSRDAIAAQLGAPRSSIRFLEVGLGHRELGLIQDGKVNPAAAFESDLPRRYAEALGHPELHQQFSEQFSIPQPGSGTSR